MPPAPCAADGIFLPPSPRLQTPAAERWTELLEAGRAQNSRFRGKGSLQGLELLPNAAWRQREVTAPPRVAPLGRAGAASLRSPLRASAAPAAPAAARASAGRVQPQRQSLEEQQVQSIEAVKRSQAADPRRCASQPTPLPRTDPPGPKSCDPSTSPQRSRASRGRETRGRDTARASPGRRLELLQPSPPGSSGSLRQGSAAAGSHGGNQTGNTSATRHLVEILLYRV